MDRRKFLSIVAASTLCAPAVARRAAAGIVGDHELRFVLGFDVSSSMTTNRDGRVPNAVIQRDGHIRALSSPRVMERLLSKKPIVHCVAWAASPNSVREFVAARQIRTEADLNGLCADIRQHHPLKSNSFTYHDVLLDYVLKRIPADSRLILDVSTDEEAKRPQTCANYRDQLYVNGWTINALAVGSGAAVRHSMEDCIKTNTGFVQSAYDWQDYAEALEKKMFLELV